MAKRNSKAHMAYVRSFRKGAPKRRRATRRRKSNPWPVAGMVVNPHRRRRRSHSRSVARRTRRNSYRRNPAIMGISLPPMKKVAFAGIGFLGTPMLENAIATYIPASFMTSTVGKYAVRVGAAMLLAFGIRKFVGKEEGDMALIGGGVNILATAAVEFLPGTFGTVSVPSTALSAYVTPNRALAAYVPSNQRINSALGAYQSAASNGATDDTAARFRRL